MPPHETDRPVEPGRKTETTHSLLRENVDNSRTTSSDTPEREPGKAPDSLVALAEKTDIGKRSQTMGFLEHIEQDSATVKQAVESRGIRDESHPLMRLSSAYSKITAEIATALNDSQHGRGIDPASLRTQIGKISGYRMLLPSADAQRTLSTDRLEVATHTAIRDLHGSIAELHFANRVVHMENPTSLVVMGAHSQLGDGSCVFRDRKTGDQVATRLSPLGEVDIAYLGKDSKTHVVEVKSSPSALMRTLEEKPEQLTNLGDWQSASGGEREASIAIHSSTNWTQLALKPLDTRARSAFDILIEHTIPLRIGDVPLSVPRLKELNQLLKENPGTLTNDFFSKLSRHPGDVEKGLDARLKEVTLQRAKEDLEAKMRAVFRGEGRGGGRRRT